MYSQKGEDNIIWDYLTNKGIKGAFLDIGANDGNTLSNTYRFALDGWEGVLVDASPMAFKRLQEIHGENKKLHLFNYAITNKDGECTFHESGHIKIHREGVNNVGLVSSMHENTIPKWKGRVSFQKITIPCKTFASFLADSPIKKFEYISIDIEGEEMNVLKQMNLDDLGCRLLCIEHNQSRECPEYLSYCAQWGFTEHFRTRANIILVR